MDVSALEPVEGVVSEVVPVVKAAGAEVGEAAFHERERDFKIVSKLLDGRHEAG